MNFIKIEKNDDDTYSLFFDDNFYKYFTKHYTSGSYFNIFYRLFGFLPQDFYHMAAAKYNAIFQPNPYVKRHIRMKFKTKNDATILAKEINTRLNNIVKREDFY